MLYQLQTKGQALLDMQSQLNRQSNSSSVWMWFTPFPDTCDGQAQQHQWIYSIFIISNLWAAYKCKAKSNITITKYTINIWMTNRSDRNQHLQDNYFLFWASYFCNLLTSCSTVLDLLTNSSWGTSCENLSRKLGVIAAVFGKDKVCHRMSWKIKKLPTLVPECYRVSDWPAVHLFFSSEVDLFILCKCFKSTIDSSVF